MLEMMHILESDEEVFYLLQMVDPYNNQRMTYSEVVHLLSSHMVPISYQNPQQTIPLLEKFVNKYGDEDLGEEPMYNEGSEERFQRESNEQDEQQQQDMDGADPYAA